MASVMGMAPFVAGLLHAAQPQITSVNGKAMARRSSTCRTMASGVEQPNSSSHGHDVPISEPFNQSRISRQMRGPSLLETAENALADKCTHLEGDEAYSCWEALFEFENIKEEYQQECDVASADERASACSRLERFQNLVRQSGGASGLIDNVRMVARTAKMRQLQQQQQQQASSEEGSQVADKAVVPEEEGPARDSVVDESSGLLPESNLTRMLRHSGLSPAWFTRRPDHESD